MEQFVIQGGKKLKGSVRIRGAKNASAPIIAATTLIKGECLLHNVPRIADIEMMVDILKSMGANAAWTGQNSLTIDCTDIDVKKIDFHKVSKIRASILLIGCLAQRFGTVTMALPGGCNIGSRPLDAHFEALEELGYQCSFTEDTYTITKAVEPHEEIVMKEFSVTATEIVIMASVLSPNQLSIKCCAAEHVVQDLCWFLNHAGARIEGIGTHSLSIQGVSSLAHVEYTVMPDPIETGTFIALSGLTHANIRIENAAPEFLALELRKFGEVGMSFSFQDIREDALGHYKLATIIPEKVRSLKAIKKLHPMPYPGFAADLIQPFALLMTQAEGISLIHDWMYDGRLRYATELQKMGANITILDPHRITVIGPTPLYAKEIMSYDLRAGATIVLAGIIAEGKTIINGIEQVDRGYEKFDEQLRSIGADITRTTA